MKPTAVERLLAAAQARAEAEAARARAGGGPADDELYDDGYGPGGAVRPRERLRRPDWTTTGPTTTTTARTGATAAPCAPTGAAARWHRPVAWLLALLMGIGMVALAFSAVYRGASANRQDQVPPPATTGVDSAPGSGVAPSASADYFRPAVSAVPRTP